MSSVPRALPGTKGVGKVNREELAVQRIWEIILEGFVGEVALEPSLRGLGR